MLRRLAPLLALALAACTGQGGPGAAPSPAAGGRPAGGMGTPAPLRGPPQIGKSELGTDFLRISYENPHLRLWAEGVPAGAASVTYSVVSLRFKDEKLQVIGYDSGKAYEARIEYMRLLGGEHMVSAHVENDKQPFDQIKLVVP